jgi:hypothetical protein
VFADGTGGTRVDSTHVSNPRSKYELGNGFALDIPAKEGDIEARSEEPEARIARA